MQVLQNGIGQALGPGLVVNGGLNVVGNVWYVNSATGSDAASPQGQDPEYPLATLSQALTNSAAYDVIVLMDGHAETIAAKLTITARTVVGGGKSSGKPTVKLTNNQAAAAMLELASSSQLINVWVEENAQGCSEARITVTGDGVRVVDCYFECDGNDNPGTSGEAGALQVNAGDFFLCKGCTFISTATLTTDRPGRAVGLENAGTGIVIRPAFVDCIFDGGTVGWNQYAIECRSAIDTQQLIGENISLLRGSDASFSSGGGATHGGYFQVTTSSGGSRVYWS